MSRLAGLLARLFPGHGRHQQLPGPDDTVDLPRVRDDGWHSASEVTRIDLPPAFGGRPYLPGGEDDGQDRYRGFLP